MTTTHPTFHNYEAQTQALGLAVSDNGLTYYTSCAGPGVAVKSTWATLVANNSTQLECLYWNQVGLTGVNPIKSFYASLPHTNFQHLVAVSDLPELIIVTDPTAAILSDPDDPKRSILLDRHWPVIRQHFTAYLSQHTSVPVLQSWASTIWKHAAHHEAAITSLTAFGDCIGAWLIESEFDWSELVQELLATHKLDFTQGAIL